MVVLPANALGTRAGRHEPSSRCDEALTSRCPGPPELNPLTAESIPDDGQTADRHGQPGNASAPPAVGVVARWIHWWRASGTHDDVGAGSSAHGPVFSPSAATNCASAASDWPSSQSALEAERGVGVCDVLGPIGWRLDSVPRRTHSPAHVRRESPARPAAMNRQPRGS